MKPNHQILAFMTERLARVVVMLFHPAVLARRSHAIDFPTSTVDLLRSYNKIRIIHEQMGGGGTRTRMQGLAFAVSILS